MPALLGANLKKILNQEKYHNIKCRQCNLDTRLIDIASRFF